MAEIGRQELIRLMVGRELSAVFPKKTVPLREVVLELRQLKCQGAESAGVDLSLRGGEILGPCRARGRGPDRAGRNCLRLETGRIRPDSLAQEANSCSHPGGRHRVRYCVPARGPTTSWGDSPDVDQRKYLHWRR